MHTAKIETSLHIGQSDLSLSFLPEETLNPSWATHRGTIKDSDQTAQMRRLV